MRRTLLPVVAALTLLTLSAAPGLSQEPNEYVERMEREHAGDVPVASGAAESEPAVAVTGSEVVYGTIGGVELRGYAAHPAEGRPRAGLIVIHEWWGLNDNIRAMTGKLAGEGYLALAVDLYEGEVAEDRETAAKLARGSASRGERLVENLGRAIDHLHDAGIEPIGVIGWCFGGGWSLRTALAYPGEIDAAVIYYGRLTDDRDELTKLQAPVLGIFGALDEGIPVAAVREFQLALDGLGKEASVHVYEGADHAFANPSGTRYNREAAEDAWAKTTAFFAAHLK